jgi:hypothetical protein
MKNSQLIAIESKSGVTLYGRVIDSKGKLGQFEVHSDFAGTGGFVYHLYKEAQNRMNALIGVKSS